MKTVKIIIVAILAIVITSIVYSQSVTTKTESLKVSGNCDICKARIEKAAKIEGVTSAQWNLKDKTLIATFDPEKTNMDEIGKKIAAAGHDNGKVKATDAAYNKLPSCCHYR